METLGITTEPSRIGSLGRGGGSDLFAPSGSYRGKAGIPDSMVLPRRALAVGAVGSGQLVAGWEPRRETAWLEYGTKAPSEQDNIKVMCPRTGSHPAEWELSLLENWCDFFFVQRYPQLTDPSAHGTWPPSRIP